MLLAYYHVYVNKEHLRTITFTTKEGTSAYGLIQGAETIGFETKALSGTFEEFQNEFVPFPVIAHVIKEDAFHHYILIYKIDHKKRRLYIADPGYRLEWVTYDTFQLEWTNLILLFYPTHITSYDTKPNRVGSFLFTLACGHIKKLMLLFFFSLFRALFSILVSFYLKGVIDIVTTTGSMEELSGYSTLFLGLFLIQEWNRELYIYFLTTYHQTIDYILMNDFFGKIISLPYNSFRVRTTGEIVSYFNELGKLKEVLLSFFSSLSLDAMLSFVSLILLFMNAFTLGVLALILIGGTMALFFLYRKFYPRLVFDDQKQKALVSVRMIESISGYMTIKALHLEKRWKERFRMDYLNFHRTFRRLTRVKIWEQNMMQVLEQTIRYLFIMLGGIMILKGNLSVGNFLFCTTLLEYIITPTHSLLSFFFTWLEAKNAYQTISFLLDQKREEGKFQLVSVKKVAFSHLDFSYDGDTFIFKDFSISFTHGESMMVLGPSGSGKSTLFQILMRFYQIKQGQVKLDGVDSLQYDDNSFYQHFAYLSQSETLFTTTLYENITLYRSVKQEAFLKACQCCDLESWVTQFSGGYHMLIEEDGKNLSGGQRQRILLARLLLLPAQFLILDESLNQVEVKLEEQILRRILEFYPEKTLVYITHRQHNFHLFSRIIELNKGHVIRDLKRKETQLC